MPRAFGVYTFGRRRGAGVAFVFVLREHRPIHGFEYLIVSHFKLCRVDGVVLDRI